MITLIENKFHVDVATKILFGDKLKYIEEIISELSKDFVKEEQDIEDEFWNSIGDVTDLSEEDYEFHTEQLENLKEKHKHLPQILYKSIIVSIYSILETTISEIVFSIEKNIPKKIKYKNLKTVGSEIENSLNFLHLVHDINYSEIKSTLIIVKNFADIRNNIVHRNGSLKEENLNRKNRIKKFVSTRESLLIEDDEKLFIKNSEFLSKFITLTDSFGFKLFDLLKIEK